MLPKYSYEEATAALLAALTRDVLLHEAGRFDNLGESYDEVDTRLPRNADPEFNKLIFAHEFWAGWLDAREHDWMFYEPIKQADWPRFARQIIPGTWKPSARQRIRY